MILPDEMEGICVMILEYAEHKKETTMPSVFRNVWPVVNISKFLFS